MKKNYTCFNNNYTLGIDMGTSKIGWCIIDEDKTQEMYGGPLELGEGVVDIGVINFTEATTNANQDRRTARGQRRSIRRRKFRGKRILALLKIYGVYDEAAYKPSVNVYDIRIKGLTTELTRNELVSAVFHISKRRGSDFDYVESDNDGQTKKMLSQNSAELKEKGFYVCQLQKERLLEGKVRNINNFFKSDEYKLELEQILSNISYLDVSQKQEIIKLVFQKRDYSDGPGDALHVSPYGKWSSGHEESMINKMRGKCGYYPDQYRAPKMSMSGQLVDLLNDLNNIKIASDVSRLTTDQKQKVVDYVLSKGSITFKQLCDLLDIDDVLVSGYRTNASGPILTSLDGYKAVAKLCRDNLVDASDFLKTNVIDFLSEVLTTYKKVSERREKLLSGITDQITLTKEENPFNDENVDIFANSTVFSGYGSYSFKANKFFYDELMSKNINTATITLDLRNEHIRKTMSGQVNIPLVDSDDYTNKVVTKASNITIRLVNRLRRQYGEFKRIVIEMPRDNNTDDQRKRIIDEQRRNKARRRTAQKLLNEFSLTVNDTNILKVCLWLDQGEYDLYTGKPMSIVEAVTCDIDHILPRSVTFNNSLNNMVLVSRYENGTKGKRTPWETFGYVSDRWDRFQKLIKQLSSPKSRNVAALSSEHKSIRDLFFLTKTKANNLLTRESFDKYENVMKFTARSLNDTRWASKVVLGKFINYFRVNNIPTIVKTIKGVQTGYYRNMAVNSSKMSREQKEALEAKNRDYLYNHAIDAFVIALSSVKDLQSVDLEDFDIDEDGNMFDKKTGELYQKSRDIKDVFSRREQIIKFLKNSKTMLYLTNLTEYDPRIKIEHKPLKKMTGKLSDQTILSIRPFDGDDYIVKRFDIYSNKTDINKYYLQEFKDYVEGKTTLDKCKIRIAQTDVKTFLYLVDIYKAYVDDASADKSFGGNPFLYFKTTVGDIKTVSRHDKGTPVKSLTVRTTKISSFLDVSHKYVLRDDRKVGMSPCAFSMPYVEVYKDNSRYYIKQIFYHMLNKKENINRDNIPENAKKLFDLYPYSTVRVKYELNNEKYEEDLIYSTCDNRRMFFRKKHIQNMSGDFRMQISVSKIISINVVDNKHYL